MGPRRPRRSRDRSAKAVVRWAISLKRSRRNVWRPMIAGRRRGPFPLEVTRRLRMISEPAIAAIPTGSAQSAPNPDGSAAITAVGAAISGTGSASTPVGSRTTTVGCSGRAGSSMEVAARAEMESVVIATPMSTAPPTRVSNSISYVFTSASARLVYTASRPEESVASVTGCPPAPARACSAAVSLSEVVNETTWTSAVDAATV